MVIIPAGDMERIDVLLATNFQLLYQTMSADIAVHRFDEREVVSRKVGAQGASLAQLVRAKASAHGLGRRTRAIE